MKQDVGLPSNLVAERCLSKHDNKSDNSADQRTLKLRIKVNSDYLAQKNAAIYSNLGLSNSPSSSMGNSPEGSGGIPPVSQEIAEESPTGIIQVMDLFHFYAWFFADTRRKVIFIYSKVLWWNR